jgi:hypothetical protein
LNSDLFLVGDFLLRSGDEIGEFLLEWLGLEGILDFLNSLHKIIGCGSVDLLQLEDVLNQHLYLKVKVGKKLIIIHTIFNILLIVKRSLQG